MGTCSMDACAILATVARIALSSSVRRPRILLTLNLARSTWSGSKQEQAPIQAIPSSPTNGTNTTPPLITTLSLSTPAKVHRPVTHALPVGLVITSPASAPVRLDLMAQRARRSQLLRKREICWWSTYCAESCPNNAASCNTSTAFEGEVKENNKN